jgi:hypothetical protein
MRPLACDKCAQPIADGDTVVAPDPALAAQLGLAPSNEKIGSVQLHLSCAQEIGAISQAAVDRTAELQALDAVARAVPDAEVLS